MIDVEIKVTYGSFAPPKTLLDDIAEIKTKEHTHDNFDAINQVTESVLVDIRSNTNARHSHSNKDIIDSISENELNNITENTAARHSHANTDTLGKLGESGGKLTYDGKAVGGDSRTVIEETFTEEYGDFAFVLTASNTYPVKNAVLTVASDSITENTEIKSVKILFSGKTDYVDVKDIPIKYNGYFEPCIVSAFHPVADDGSESLVVGFKVASLYFPVDCKAYTDIRNGSYSAVKVEYYGG